MPRKRKSVATEDAAGDKPVYLVVEHKVKDKEPSHSIFIAAAAGTSRTTTTPRVMVPLRHASRGMSFAAVDSRWIVGVGGDRQCPCTVYDIATYTESRGPRLMKTKVNPILIPNRGGMLYVLSRQPKVDIWCSDFLPWFELITFNPNGKGHVAPYELPPPPIFPYSINPLEYADPPDVRVAAYAVVDSHILLSVSVFFEKQQRQQEKGTCAFDMDMDMNMDMDIDRRAWDMVDTKSLPFLGQAIPLGDDLFVARSKDDGGGAVAVYYMAVTPAKDTTAGKTEVSIIVKSRILDLPQGGIVLGQHLCAMGMGFFSSFDVPSAADHGPDTTISEKKPRVVQRTYSLVKVKQGADDTSSTHLKLIKWQRQIFKLPGPAPLIAAFTV